MPHEKLHETLSVLHGQLQGNKPLDDADKTHLKEILHDIERALDADTAPADMSDRINASMARFEASHPAIATGLQEIVDLLKRL